MEAGYLICVCKFGEFTQLDLLIRDKASIVLKFSSNHALIDIFFERNSHNLTHRQKQCSTCVESDLL